MNKANIATLSEQSLKQSSYISSHRIPNINTQTIEQQPFFNKSQLKINRKLTYQPYKVEYKQQGKGLYSSSVNSKNNFQKNKFQKNSFAKYNVSPTSITNKYQTNKIFDNNEKFVSPKNDNVNNQQKNNKFAISTITFHNNYYQAQHKKFPSFLLNSNQIEQKPTHSNLGSSFSTQNLKFKYSKSDKQKKQKEIIEIKKKLNQLTKKLFLQTEKSSQNTELKPQKLPSKPSTLSTSSSSSVLETFSQNSNGNFKSNFSMKKNQQYPKKFKTVVRPPLEKMINYPKNNENVQNPTPFVVPSYKISPTSYQKNYNENYQFSGSEVTNYKLSQVNKNNLGTLQPFSYKYENNYQQYQPIKQNNFTKTYQNFSSKYTQQYQPISNNSNASTNKYFIVNNSVCPPTTIYHDNYFKKGQNGQLKASTNKKEQPMFDHMKKNSDFGKINNQPIFKKKENYDSKWLKQQYSYTNIMNDHRQINQQKINNQNIFPKQKIKISDFLIIKKMGKGQFGQVKLVVHKQTKFICGLKIMQKQQIKKQKYVQQIIRELSIQFYLCHRYILPLYGYFHDERNIYLLIEFCVGGQLLQKLKQQHRISQTATSTIIKQVCQGIDYMHKQLIIHRDVKPQNILFNFGVVKISDFGWSVYNGFGMRKTASGSPLYYPPQIVKGESYDQKIDIWNIGMMTYECIIGKVPFQVYTEMDLKKIISDQITFPPYVDVTDQTKDFILKTMDKQREKRMEMREMLRHPFIVQNQKFTDDLTVLQQYRNFLG